MDTRIIKKSFERKQKVAAIALCVACVLFGWSCQNRNEVDLPEPLSDEEILLNLSKSGNFDPELLIGEWDCVRFAYTADGRNISDVVEISKGRLTIPNEPFIKNRFNIENDWERIRKSQWSLDCLNWYGFFCLSLGKNIIEFVQNGYTFAGTPTPHVEHDLTYAIRTARSYVIRGNELLFYFQKIDDGNLVSNFEVIKKNKTNILILKKK